MNLAEYMAKLRTEAVDRVTALLRSKGLPPGEIEGEQKAERLAEEILAAIFGVNT